MDKTTINYLWEYLEDGTFFLADIDALARGYGPPGYWDRNAVFALLILAAEGEL